MNVNREVAIGKHKTIGKTKSNFEELLKSNLDFADNKNAKGSRHNWHAFPAKFPPNLPKLFIEHLTRKNDVVLDPMMGSCTTLVESAGLGRRALGFDIDPLALINGEAKFQNVSLVEAFEKGKSLIERAISMAERQEKFLKGNLQQKFDAETKAFIDYWFLPKTQIELIAILNEIEKIKSENIKSFFISIFSSIIITKSGGITLALDLAHTRPHKKEDKKINSAFTEFLKRLTKNLTAYTDLPGTGVKIQRADAKKMPLDQCSVDLIITSPPYANNAIDYIRAHKFSLVWFGYSIHELKDTRKRFIGSESIQNSTLNDLPKYSTDKIFQLASVDSRRGKSLHHYYSEMMEVLKEMHRVLKPESASVIVVASSVLKGIDVETHKCLGEIGQSVGLELIHIGERNIDRNKRMMPASHIKNSSQIESRMHKEYILGFWKN